MRPRKPPDAVDRDNAPADGEEDPLAWQWSYGADPEPKDEPDPDGPAQEETLF